MMCMDAAPRIRMNKLDATGRPTDRCLLPRTVGNWRGTLARYHSTAPRPPDERHRHNSPHSPPVQPPHGDETTLVGHGRAQCHASASSTCSSLDTAPGREAEEGVVRMRMEFVFQGSAARVVTVGSNPTLRLLKHARPSHFLSHPIFATQSSSRLESRTIRVKCPVSWENARWNSPHMNSC